MKVWCVPVNFPNPEKEPEQAEAAKAFVAHFTGLIAISPGKNGVVSLVFTEKEYARIAKWKLEEYSPENLEIIEGTMTKDKKVLKLHRVLKGG